jgi:hypothetical protein
MSRLAVGKEDHPEAAQKHFDDLQALVGAKRHDGAAYHAGYVVECALCAFRPKPITDSGASRSPIPVHADH